MRRRSDRSSAELGSAMSLEAHRHIRFATTEIELHLDGTVRSVCVLYSDLELSRLNPGYDANAVEELVSRTQAFQKTHHQLVRLRTIERQ